ncbi:hypothetical protein B7463_g1765, partial [Scytalidium lignicola]
MANQGSSKSIRLASSTSLRSHRKTEKRDCSSYSNVSKIYIDQSKTTRSSAPSTPYQGSVDRKRSFPIEFERTHDIIGVRDDSNYQGPVFEDRVPSSYFNHYERGFFVLPASIRKQIYSECFSIELRKISLSPHFATAGVFPDDYFASPWEVLSPILGALHTCVALRYELMTYFWMHYHFHVTLSIFTGLVFSPLSSIWLVENIDLVQHLTIELDLTRLDGNCVNVKTQPKGSKLDQFLINLITGIATSHRVSKIAELSFMCRRYSRFGALGKVEIEDVFTYPDEHQYLHDAAFQLRGTVQMSRVSGFSFRYSRMLLDAMFGEGYNRPKYIYPPESPWPIVICSPAVTPLKTCPTPRFTNSTPPFNSSRFGTPSSHDTSDARKFDTFRSRIPRNRARRSSSMKTITSSDKDCESGTTDLQSPYVIHVKKHGLSTGNPFASRTTHQLSSPKSKYENITLPVLLDSVGAKPESSELINAEINAPEIGNRHSSSPITPTKHSLPRCPIITNDLSKDSPYPWVLNALNIDIGDPTTLSERLVSLNQEARDKKAVDVNRPQTSCGSHPTTYGQYEPERYKHFKVVKKVLGHSNK